MESKMVKIADVKPHRHTQIDVIPLAGALGAEVRGVDIAGGVDDDLLAEIHRAWLDHHVIYFRDQNLTPDQHVAFAMRFGGIHLHLFNKSLDGHPEIIEMLKTPEETVNNGDVWHSDQMYTPKPAKGTMLYGREIPPYGGDTMFANLYLAYEALSEGLKNTLAGLKGVNNGDTKNNATGMSRMDRVNAGLPQIPHVDPGDAQTISIHPLVRTHPETGRKALYLGYHTDRIDGWSSEESKPLLAYLDEHAHRPEFTCRMRWEKDTLTFWDNRCTQHFAVNDYTGYQRRIHKVMIQGDTPI